MEMLVVSLCLMATLRGFSAGVVGTSTTEKLDLSFFDNLASETSNPVHLTPETAAPPAIAKPTASPIYGVPSQESGGSVPTDAFIQSGSPINLLSQFGQFPFVPSAPQFTYENFLPPVTGGFYSEHPSSSSISSLPSVPHLSQSGSIPLPYLSSHTSSANRPSAFWPSFLSHASQPNTVSSANLYPQSLSFHAPVESLPSSVSGSYPTGNFYSHSSPILSQAPPHSLSMPPAQVLSPAFPLSSSYPSTHLSLSPPVASSSIKTYAPSHPLLPSETLPSPSSGTSAPVVATFIRSYVPSNQFSNLPFLPPSQNSVSYSPYGLNTLPSHLSWNDIASAIVNSYVPSSPIVSSISRNPAAPYVSAPSYSYPQPSYSSVPMTNMASGARYYPTTPVQPSVPFISSASPAYSIKSHNSQPSFSALGPMPSSSSKNLLYSYNNYPPQFNTI